MKKTIAVVTGGNRGIGREICRQLACRGAEVVLTARDVEKGGAAAAALAGEGLAVHFHPLDVAVPEQARALADWIGRELGGVDLLVNNAGVFLDARGAGVMDTDPDLVRRTMEINLCGPLHLVRALVPLMRRRGGGRIVNLSSGLGQLSEMGGGQPAYRMSKTALNALTRILAAELAGDHIRVNAMCPGWVRTDMGGPNAEREVEQGADTAVWLGLDAPASLTGGFFRDRKPIPW